MKGKETDVDIGLIEAWGQGLCFRWWDGVGFEVYGRHQATKKIHCPVGHVGVEVFEAQGRRSGHHLGLEVRVGMRDMKMMVHCGHRV